MKTLLTNDQRALFLAFSQKEATSKEDPKILEQKKNDQDYEFFHENTQSNFCKLISLDSDQFENIKDFLTMPTDSFLENFLEKKELRYACISSIADVLSTDWVYFPQSSIRREMLKLWHSILGCELNFVLCLTAVQRQQLRL